MSDLFKNGDDFEFKQVDYSSKRMQKIINKIQAQQDEIRNSAKVDRDNPILHRPFTI